MKNLMKKAMAFILILALAMPCSSQLTVSAADSPTSGTDGNVAYSFSNGTLTFSLVEGKEKGTISKTYTNMSWAKSVSEIVINGNITSISNDKGCFLNFTELVAVTLNEGLLTIGPNTFNGCSRLTSIIIPESVTAIKSKSFANCSQNLLIYYKGSACQFQSALAYEGNNVDEYGNKEYELYNIGCNKIQCYREHNFEVSSCKPLKKSTKGYEVSYKCKTDGCGKKKKRATYTLTFNAVLTSNEGNNATFDMELVSFSTSSVSPITVSCKDLLKGYSVKKISSIGEKHVDYISKFEFPSTVISIEDYAFKDCKYLYLKEIPSNIITIGAGAFMNCTAMREITIPSNVISIGAYAFGYTCEKNGLPEKINYFSIIGHSPVAKRYASDNGMNYQPQHTVVIDYGYQATCTREGKTNGSHCSVCGEVIESQVTIAKSDHKYTTYVPNNDATTERDGTRTAYCDYGCGSKHTIVDVGSKLPNNSGENNNGNDNGGNDNGNVSNGDNSNVNNPGLQIQTIKVKKYKKTFQAAALRVKGYSFKLKVSAKGKVSFKVVKGKKKNIKVTSSGKVTMKKNCKKGTYKIRISAAATDIYQAATKTITIRVK